MQKKKDFSPISLRALLTVRSTLGMYQLADLYKITNPNILFRLAGAGFRVRSRLYSTNRAPRWERLWVASTKPPGTSRSPFPDIHIGGAAAIRSTRPSMMYAPDERKSAHQ